MHIATIKGLKDYLKKNQDAVIEIFLNEARPNYTTNNIIKIDDKNNVIYAAINDKEDPDMAIIPIDAINHVILKDSNTTKKMGFTP